MTVVLPYLYLMLISISFAIILKKNFYLVIPVTSIFTAIVIMFTGYVGDLRIGIYVNMVFVLIALILVIIKKRSLKEIFSVDNAIILVIYSLFFMYIGYYYKFGHFTWFDDFGHWGPMVKGMVQYNKLYTYLPINNSHPDYPPLVQCFEYLWCYLSGGYSEPSVFRALAVFTFSLFTPIFELINNKTIKTKIVYSTLITILIMVLNTVSYKYFSSYLTSIYLDFIMATCAGVIIFIIIMFDYLKHSNIIYKIVIMMYLLSMLLLKEIGIAFYFMALFIILLFSKYENRKQLIMNLLFYMVIPIAIFLSWKLFTSGINGQFNTSKISIIDAIRALLLNKGTDFMLLIKDKYVDALFTKSILNGMEISFISLCVALGIILLITTLCLYKEKYKKIIIINLAYLLGVVGYIFTMYALYISCFSVDEAITLASYERYFAIYIHFAIVLLSLLLIMLFSIKQRKTTMIMILIFFALLITNCDIKLLFNRQKMSGRGVKYNQMSEQINAVLDRGDEKILLFTYDDFLTATMLKYDNLNNTNISNFNLFHYYYGEYVFKDRNELINLYKDFDYVYIYYSGEELWKVWKQTSNDDLYNNRLYKVQNDKLILVPWANPID